MDWVFLSNATLRIVCALEDNNYGVPFLWRWNGFLSIFQGEIRRLKNFYNGIHGRLLRNVLPLSLRLIPHSSRVLSLCPADSCCLHLRPLLP